MAAAGYSGFIPNIKYEIGKSYGNATREILERDKVFAQRKLKQQYEDGRATLDSVIRKDNKNMLSNGDERFSSALVAGYTGKERSGE